MVREFRQVYFPGFIESARETQCCKQKISCGIMSCTVYGEHKFLFICVKRKTAHKNEKTLPYRQKNKKKRIAGDCVFAVKFKLK